MKQETKEQLDDLAAIAKGINNTIENVAISGRPCELHSFWKQESGRNKTDKIVSSTLTQLLVTGLSSELRSMESYLTRRFDEGKVDIDTTNEILERLKEIRNMM